MLSLKNPGNRVYKLPISLVAGFGGIQCWSLPSHLMLQPRGLVSGTLTVLPRAFSQRLVQVIDGHFGGFLGYPRRGRYKPVAVGRRHRNAVFSNAVGQRSFLRFIVQISQGNLNSFIRANHVSKLSSGCVCSLLELIATNLTALFNVLFGGLPGDFIRTFHEWASGCR